MQEGGNCSFYCFGKKHPKLKFPKLTLCVAYLQKVVKNTETVFATVLYSPVGAHMYPHLVHAVLGPTIQPPKHHRNRFTFAGLTCITDIETQTMLRQDMCSNSPVLALLAINNLKQVLILKQVVNTLLHLFVACHTVNIVSSS